MSLTTSSLSDAFSRLALPGGCFAMIAADQRESLRGMFDAVMDGGHADDMLLADFKLAVAQELAPTVSAILFDRLQGREALDYTREEHPACGIILAADELVQAADGPVTDTRLDAEVGASMAAASGAAALKLLVIWRDDAATQERCLRTAEAFVGRCGSWGLLSIVEAVVRPSDGADASGWDREASLINAAAQLGRCRPDLYKAELPLYGRGSVEQIQEACESVSSVLDCPWVVLSSGVSAEDFPRAVVAASRGGASGFLAGRAIWRDAVHPVDYRRRLRDVSLPRARELVELVQSEARPWHEVHPEAR